MSIKIGGEPASKQMQSAVLLTKILAPRNLPPTSSSLYSAANMRAVVMARFHQRRLFLFSLGAMVSGCAQWQGTKDRGEAWKLPAAALPPNSVVLEIAFAHLPATDQTASDAIWAEADEQQLPGDLRRQLAENGLRVGIIGSQLPPKLREVLDHEGDWNTERVEDVQGVEGELNRAPQRRTCRSGERVKIFTSKRYDSLALLIQEEGFVRGKLVDQGQCLLGLKAYPQGDSRVKLLLTPEVEHGALRSQWVGSEGALMQQIGRERLTLENLKIETMLAPGHTLIVSAATAAKGLGDKFFLETVGGVVERNMLLIRLAVSQQDDLFAPDQMAAPLATPGE